MINDEEYYPCDNCDNTAVNCAGGTAVGMKWSVPIATR
nr:MAG TPA: hypothetical protein [Caudoviricetes sp.]